MHSEPFFQPLTILSKSSILDVWQSSQDPCENHQIFVTTKYKAWIHFKNSRSTYKNSLENICNGIFLWKSWIHGCVGLLQVYSTVDILLHSLQNILGQLFNKASRLEFCNIYKKTCVGVSIEEELFYRTPLVAVSTSKNVLLGIYFRSSICIIVPWPNQTNFTVKLWRVMIRIK